MVDRNATAGEATQHGPRGTRAGIRSLAGAARRRVNASLRSVAGHLPATHSAVGRAGAVVIFLDARHLALAVVAVRSAVTTANRGEGRGATRGKDDTVARLIACATSVRGVLVADLTGSASDGRGRATARRAAGAPD